MKVLARQILDELGRASHCAVYEEDLVRVWPLSDSQREAKIRKFARAHGWRLRFYHKGLCAIFDKDFEAGIPG